MKYFLFVIAALLFASCTHELTEQEYAQRLSAARHSTDSTLSLWYAGIGVSHPDVAIKMADNFSLAITPPQDEDALGNDIYIDRMDKIHAFCAEMQYRQGKYLPAAANYGDHRNPMPLANINRAAAWAMLNKYDYAKEDLKKIKGQENLRDYTMACMYDKMGNKDSAIQMYKLVQTKFVTHSVYAAKCQERIAALEAGGEPLKEMYVVPFTDILMAQR